MITVIQLFHELSGHNCLSCNSRGVHDLTQSDVFIDCHFAGQDNVARFVVTVTTFQGACLINGTFDCDDTIEVTLTSEVLCYDPCEEDYYNQFDNCVN